MKCWFCQQESGAIMRGCPLVKVICAKCCFHIAAGEPEYIDKVKRNLRMMKEDILKRCSECNPVK